MRLFGDYRLPGIDGLEFFKRIQESHPHAMKILITAHGNVDVISGAMRIGIHDFIEKPFTSAIIEESLSRVIKNRGEEDRLPPDNQRYKEQETGRVEKQTELIGSPAD